LRENPWARAHDAATRIHAERFLNLEWETAETRFLLLPRLAPDALLLADNALSHPQETQGYLDCVDATGLFDARTLTVGKVLHLAVRRNFLKN